MQYNPNYPQQYTGNQCSNIQIPPPPPLPPNIKSNSNKSHYTLSEVELTTFRTQLCESHRRGKCVNADSCPHSHCLTWQRRNPYEIFYYPQLCPGIEFRRANNKMSLVRQCNKGKSCQYAHSKEEELYHPLAYKTKNCSMYPQCDRHYCPFAHGPQEMRYPFTIPLIQWFWGKYDKSSPLPTPPLMMKQSKALNTMHRNNIPQLPEYTPNSSYYRNDTATPMTMRTHSLFYPTAQSSNADTCIEDLNSILNGHSRDNTDSSNSTYNNSTIQSSGVCIADQKGDDLCALFEKLNTQDIVNSATTSYKEKSHTPNNNNNNISLDIIRSLAQDLLGPQASKMSTDQILITLDLALKLATNINQEDKSVHKPVHVNQDAYESQSYDAILHTLLSSSTRYEGSLNQSSCKYNYTAPEHHSLHNKLEGNGKEFPKYHIPDTESKKRIKITDSGLPSEALVCSTISDYTGYSLPIENTIDPGKSKCLCCNMISELCTSSCSWAMSTEISHLDALDHAIEKPA